MNYATREDWLTDAVAQLRPIFDVIGKPIPNRIRVTAGHPINFKRNRRLGDCHAAGDSADRSIEICVSPTIAKPVPVFTVLLSQLCRATAGALSYGTAYESIATEVGLVPTNVDTLDKWKTCTGNAMFTDLYGELIAGLGDYPHAALGVADSRTQSTRMLKAFCPECSYTVRLTSKWAAMGLPTCPLDSTVFTLETPTT
jgi:hypothetical protein